MAVATTTVCFYCTIYVCIHGDLMPHGVGRKEGCEADIVVEDNCAGSIGHAVAPLDEMVALVGYSGDSNLSSVRIGSITIDATHCGVVHGESEAICRAFTHGDVVNVAIDCPVAGEGDGEKRRVDCENIMGGRVVYLGQRDECIGVGNVGHYSDSDVSVLQVGIEFNARWSPARHEHRCADEVGHIGIDRVAMGDIVDAQRYRTNRVWVTTRWCTPRNPRSKAAAAGDIAW